MATDKRLAEFRKKIVPYRKEIDKLDDQIIKLLGKRYGVVRKVADLKIKNDIRIVQPDRVRLVKERNARTAKKHKVSPELVRTLYALIIDEAHTIEHEMEKQKKTKKTKK